MIQLTHPMIQLTHPMIQLQCSFCISDFFRGTCDRAMAEEDSELKKEVKDEEKEEL